MKSAAVRAPRESWDQRVRTVLGGLAPVGVWRVGAAFAAALLTAMASAGGLFQYALDVQIAVVAGACAGLISPSRRWAAAVSAAAVFLARAVGPVDVMSTVEETGVRLAASLLAALMAAAVAFGVKWLTRRARGIDVVVVLFVMAVIVANMWVTTVRYAGMQVQAHSYAIPSLLQALAGAPVPVPSGGDAGDGYAYLQVLKDVQRGEPFYPTWSAELGPKRHEGASAGSSVVNYNLPVRFWFWAGVPGAPLSLEYVYLLFASVAIAAVPVMARGTVRIPFVIPAAAAMAAAMSSWAHWLTVLSGEPWAAALVVMAVAANVRSSRSARWRAWTVCSVALSVCAALFREPALLFVLAGIASAAVVRDAQRRFRLTAWATGGTAFALMYAAHFISARPYLSGPRTGAVMKLSGLDSIVSALTVGASLLGDSAVLPLTLAGVGLLGCLLIRDRRSRLLACGAVLASLLSYLFVSNDATVVVGGKAMNYWGIVIVPVIYAWIPAFFAAVPGMAPPAPFSPRGGRER